MCGGQGARVNATQMKRCRATQRGEEYRRNRSGTNGEIRKFLHYYASALTLYSTSFEGDCLLQINVRRNSAELDANLSLYTRRS